MTADADAGQPSGADARERADGPDLASGVGRDDEGVGRDDEGVGRDDEGVGRDDGAVPAGDSGSAPGARLAVEEDGTGRVVVRLGVDPADLAHVEPGDPLDADGARELAAVLDRYAAETERG